MNDFTREELNYMADGLALIIHRCTVNPRELKDKLINLGEKLQSMIDNYCEHYQYIYYGDIPVGECTECHMVMIP